MNNDLISREALKKAIEEYRSLNCVSTSTIIGVRNVFYLIDNAPTVEPKLSDEQIEKIVDLLETEWGYEGIREDVSRILKGERQ